MLENYYGKHSADPDSAVFRCKGFSPDWQFSGADRKAVTMASLPPFLRVLLVTDGTVTKSLEAYYWEPVVIDNVSNQITVAQSDIEWLGVESGEEVMTRRVLLRGERTKMLYASAFSIIRLTLIPPALKEKLLAGVIGIGELIRESGLETYRELQEIGSTTDMSQYGGPRTDTDCVFRSYRIILDHRPAILVSECFPIAVYRGG
jgi:chorismate-pyruvate lyase